MICHGVVIPVQEFFENICLKETGTTDLSKLYDKLPINRLTDKYHNKNKCGKYIEENNYIKYFLHILNDDLFYPPYGDINNNLNEDMEDSLSSTYILKFKSYSNNIKIRYIFVGICIKEDRINYNKYTEFDLKNIKINFNIDNIHIDKVENSTKKIIEYIGINSYDIYTFFIPNLSIEILNGRIMKLPDNYVPKYRKL